MAITEKRKEYLYEYQREKLKRVPLDVQKEHYERIKVHAESRSETVNGFIKRAIDETMERDNSTAPGDVDQSTNTIDKKEE